jgi:hypothetical protein
MTPDHTLWAETRTDRLIAFRNRFAGTVQDVCGGIAVLTFCLVAAAYLNGFFGVAQ